MVRLIRMTIEARRKGGITYAGTDAHLNADALAEVLADPRNHDGTPAAASNVVEDLVLLHGADHASAADSAEDSGEGGVLDLPVNQVALGCEGLRAGCEVWWGVG